MELKIFFFFNVTYDLDDGLKLTNQISYFHEAINSQTKMIWTYAAKKGIITRNLPQPVTLIHKSEPTPNGGKKLPAITISDDDHTDNDDGTGKDHCNKPTSSYNLNKRENRTHVNTTKKNGESTKRKTSQNQSVQTEDDTKVGKNQKKRYTKKKNRTAI